MGAAHHRQSPFGSICFPHYSPIPHGVAPQQSSTMLQTAAAKIQNSFYITEILTMKCSLQFELLTTYYSKTACKMSYTPKIAAIFFGPDGRHGEDYTFYYNNIKDNVAKRIATYKANH